MITLTVQRDDLTPFVNKALDALSGGQRRTVLHAMGQEFLTLTLQQFGSDRPNRPAAWPELSDRYKKRIKYFGPPMLILSGSLQQSISMELTADEAIITAHEPYAAAHQFGTHHIPARPYFPVVNGQLTEYAKEQIVKRGEEAIMRIVNG